MGSAPRRRRPARIVITPAGVAEFAAVPALSTLAAAIASWPLVRTLSGHLPGPWHPDINTAVWFRWHLLGQLRAGESPFDAPLLYWPDGMDVTLHIWNLGAALLQLPAFALIEDPLRAYNVSLLGLAALNAAAGYVLGRTVGRGDRLAGVAGAAVLLLSNLAWTEMAYGRCEQGLLAFVALYGAGLVRLLRRPDPGIAVATGVALGLAGHVYWFHAYFLLLFTGALAAVVALRDAERRPRLIALAGTAAVGLVVMAPAAMRVLLAMAVPTSVYQRTIADDPGMAALTDEMRAQHSAVLLDSLLWPLADTPHRTLVALPLVLVVVIVVALALRSVRRHAGLLPWMALFGLTMALGPRLQLRPEEPLLIGERALAMPGALLDLLPGFGRLWWPHRWLALTVVGGAGCAAALTAALRDGAGGARGQTLRRVGIALAVLLLLVELRWMYRGAPLAAFAGDPRPLAVPAFFDELSQEPGEHPLLQVPLRRIDDAALIYLPYHRQPIDGGPAYAITAHTEPAYLERIPKVAALEALEAMSRGQLGRPVDDAGGDLRELGFEYLVFWRQLDVFGYDWVTIYGDFVRKEPVYLDEHVVIWPLTSRRPIPQHGRPPPPLRLGDES